MKYEITSKKEFQIEAAKFCGRGNARSGIRKEISTYVNLERNPEQAGE